MIQIEILSSDAAASFLLFSTFVTVGFIKVIFFLGLQMFLLLVSHGFSAAMPLLYSSLDSTGAPHSGYETKAKVAFISLPLQRLLCNPLLAHLFL